MPDQERDLKSKDPPLKGDLLLDKRGFYILLFFMCFFSEGAVFSDDRKYMCFLGFPTVGKIFSFIVRFTFL